MSPKNYFDLITEDISKLSIYKAGNFNCQLLDDRNITYDGFILSKSENGNNHSVCDISFIKSDTDNKYQPRLIFRKTDNEFKTRNVNKGSDEIIISFDRGKNGYREFWTMISFLYKWRETINLDEFEDYFGITDSSLANILPKIANIENKDLVIDSLRNLSQVQINDIANLVSTSRLKNILIIWDQHKNNYDEEFWQILFQENAWILSQIFSTTYIKVGEKYYCGGKEDDNRGSVIGDFLYINNNNNLAFIEIKTPKENIIIGNIYRGEIDRANLIYSINKELTGAVNQVLNQKKEYLKYHQERNNKYLNYYKCIVLIGKTPSTQYELKSFDLYRNSLKDVEIVTFNELFDKVQSILDLFLQN
ncbi:MAG: DUF4263 domain-containing protein [Candidatus Kapabacteria bacterium]|nr:DUF4263 domain-containing protein [Candidatus Kapabacteria bacterium]